MPATIGEYLYRCYANLAMADAAVNAGREKYSRTDYMIRARLYKGLCNGTMSISSLYADEKEKLKKQVCCYCGSDDDLSLDHLVPRSHGGSDSGDNLVYACKKCNSSKGNKDLLLWYKEKNEFPPISVLRRYLKLAYEELRDAGALNKPYDDLCKYTVNYHIDLLPEVFPAPDRLKR